MNKSHIDFITDTLPKAVNEHAELFHIYAFAAGERDGERLFFDCGRHPEDMKQEDVLQAVILACEDLPDRGLSDTLDECSSLREYLKRILPEIDLTSVAGAAAPGMFLHERDRDALEMTMGFGYGDVGAILKELKDLLAAMLEKESDI